LTYNIETDFTPGTRQKTKITPSKPILPLAIDIK